MSDWIAQQERVAAGKVDAILALPLADDPNALDTHECDFDPWDIFPIYGSYSSDFDKCAVEVLKEIESGEKGRDDLGAEMFREMLCVMDLCAYGTSPRVCFPTTEFRKRLPALIEKWEAYADALWGEGWR